MDLSEPAFSGAKSTSRENCPISSTRPNPHRRADIRTPTATKSATTYPEVADPDLAAVVAAWPTLPEAIRAGIVAMVKAART
jgi:hypothetical protein